MPVFKNEGNGTWYVMARYVNWKGERKQKCKRGFATKREAQEWERKFQLQNSADLDMDFEAFTELYANDVKNRLKENTWLTKEHIIRTKILPYFGKMKISEIGTKEIIAWQNELLAYRDEKRNPYSQTYLKTVHNQLSAIFNHAVRYYDLRSNPAAKAGNMGSEEHKEMLFWTKEEYKKFADEMMDKPVSYYAFQMLYWCGIREGELLALTAADFNFDKETVTINKSYQRLHGEDVITSPKTKKSNRTIKMPKFLCEEMQEYIDMLYGLKKKDRIFTVTKSYLHHEMDRGAKAAGVKRIRIHDLRHPNVKPKTKSFLIFFGFFQVRISRPCWGVFYCSTILRIIAAMLKFTSPLLAVWMLTSKSLSRYQYRVTLSKSRPRRARSQRSRISTSPSIATVWNSNRPGRWSSVRPLPISLEQPTISKPFSFA